MGTTSDGSRPSPPKGQRRFWAFIGIFGILSVLRGIDRLADGHPVSGWLMLASGTVIALGLARLFWQWSRSPSR